jgi:hypothetical protein|tara:strand:+ start:100 stop:327 length:228 start_codon:yes stop_codon:yes gene_type:complete
MSNKIILDENPFEPNHLFWTPDNTEDLAKYLEQFSGGEKQIAYLCTMITWNLASKMIDDAMPSRDGLTVIEGGKK